MARIELFAACAAAVALSACAGDEFVTASGSGGAAAGGGGQAGSSAGGSSSGGIAGAAGNGGTGGAGGATGGGGGTTGGAGGTTGGAGGSGGTGGTPPAGCGNAHPSVALLYSTLDGNAAVITPAVIKDGIGQQFAGSFVEGPCAGKGYRVGGPGEYLRFPALLNINLVTGTLDFFFRPEFDKNDAKAHRLIGIPGLMQLVKTAQNDLVFGMGSTALAQVAAANLPFVENQWVRITVVWKTGATDMVQIYFNGSGAALKSKATGPFVPPTLTTEHLWVGAFAPNDLDHANGVFDDLKVYDGTEPPL